MINVFIIDDHPAVIEGLAFMISNHEEDDIFVVGSALNMSKALETIPKLDIQVIILDLFIGKDLPLNNFNLLKNICPDAAVMVYSAEDSIQWKYCMFKAGVNAYLGKCESPELIIPTIKKIADGSVYQSSPDSINLSTWKKMEKTMFCHEF